MKARRTSILPVLTLLMAAGAANAQPWERAVFQDVILEYRLVGAGDPVVFIHGGIFADGLEPLSSASALVTRHRVLTWRRVGYANSGPAPGHADIASQAAQLAQLMQRLDVQRAHIVGHSSGGLIALQLALDHPGGVQSLVLLEPALPLPGVDNNGIAQAVRIYRNGDRAGAIDAFMRAVAGTAWRELVEREIPLSLPQALADAPAFFEQELPAVRAWHFGEAEARRVRVPVLAVAGGNSGKVSANWPARQAFLMKHLPDVEACVLGGSSHMLALEDPQTLAACITQFFARHPKGAR